MCGRFTIMLDADDLREQLELNSLPADYRPRYNVAPSQMVAVVADAQARAVEWMRWGLIPSWARDPAIANRLINARSETAAEKPSFRQAFQKRRCVLLADGFYEWQRSEQKKGGSLPFFFRRKDARAFGLAGLWETWVNPSGTALRTCTILTTSANAVVSPVHERMPVMLSGADLWRWLELPAGESGQALMRPYPDDLMEGFAVSKAVNDPSADFPGLSQPV